MDKNKKKGKSEVILPSKNSKKAVDKKPADKKVSKADTKPEKKTAKSSKKKMNLYSSLAYKHKARKDARYAALK